MQRIVAARQKSFYDYGNSEYLYDKGMSGLDYKDNYRLGKDIQSKVLAFAFGLSAEIERNLISQRTKKVLAVKRQKVSYWVGR